MGAAAPHLARPPGGGRSDRLGARLTRFGLHPCRKGGAKTGANPTDKGKAGSKRHVVSDRGGIPLAVVLTAANVHDSKVLEEAVDSIEPIERPRGRPGRPRKRPKKLHADKAYDFPRCREALRSRAAKQGHNPTHRPPWDRLEREVGAPQRWVVERTLAWLAKYRRLTIRYERRDDIHEAFLHPGCSLICLNYLSGGF